MTSLLNSNFRIRENTPKRYRRLVNLLADQNIHVLTESEAKDSHYPWDIVCADDERNRVLHQFWMYKTLGLGDTYIKGLWKCERIDLLFKRLFALDFETQTNSIMFEIPNSLLLIIEQIAYKVFNISLIRQNDVAKKHYDLPIELYEGFLEESMKYTTGDWSGLERTPENLTAAQMQNLDYWVRELQIQDGDIVLDCGCGWGTLPQYLQSRYSVTYIGTTISDVQINYCRSKFADLDHYFFYNHSYHDPYGEILQKSGVSHITKCIFLETIEHGGTRNWPSILRNVREIITRDGILGIQTIGSEHPTLVCDPYINRYIFPHVSLGSPSDLGRALESNRQFIICQLNNLTNNYSVSGPSNSTFDHWPSRSW